MSSLKSLPMLQPELTCEHKGQNNGIAIRNKGNTRHSVAATEPARV